MQQKMLKKSKISSKIWKIVVFTKNGKKLLFFGKNVIFWKCQSLIMTNFCKFSTYHCLYIFIQNSHVERNLWMCFEDIYWFTQWNQYISLQNRNNIRHRRREEDLQPLSPFGIPAAYTRLVIAMWPEWYLGDFCQLLFHMFHLQLSQIALCFVSGMEILK